ncbi:hypothetical protein [Mycobacterium marinum]|uniref:hypothetical protein n=1 Tax=Mycobacterium marinum TaxID=1781 RepID=UPI00234027E3|nr:hypothetical protein [Mycobacterium marinum]MDC8981003.1 hypothetical protein [Mycobacterium marinum]MDC8993716.1 hypothetical protein [Mycobacterium marinum]MDC8999313.1 hypothetical protein [Mycobacterium marinum]MDC9009884.1 hypothetical protein [Mycobacterium marinum]MDC9015750.1 hypothetical protein [Mycobacterium marinum]
MRLPQKTRWGLVALSAAAVLAAGCDATIDGKPIATPGAGPTEPSFPTRRPTTSPPTSTSPSQPTSPASPTSPAGAIPLPPDDNGYVFIETKSGQTRCQINHDSVGCEAPFTNSPIKDGEHANGVHITSAGNVQWVLGNLGAIPTVTIDYKTYDAQGWIITATTDGTRFQNNGTGHGMFVSIDKVETF